MQPVSKLDVMYRQQKVGTLARARNGLFPFEYSDDWLAHGFSLNPLSLPLEKKVFMPRSSPLEGLFGVFDDSLPDGWGRLLVDRKLRALGEQPASVDSLTRCAIVGSSGMGALEYLPEWDLGTQEYVKQDYDHLSAECNKVLTEQYSDDLDELFALGGSSGGARPKILTTIDKEPWIIKFPSSYDPPEIGEQEYSYALCAQGCGIEIPEVRLFSSKKHRGYFGIKRFDRLDDGTKVHMVSAAGLLETTHRLPNLDYLDLMKLTAILTDDFVEVKKLYRLMCFNVFAHNRDDHSKNFSFVFDEQSLSWKLSPAYDLTYSSSLNNEHATTVAGNGSNPDLEDLLQVADVQSLSPTWALNTAQEIKEKTQPLRDRYTD